MENKITPELIEQAKKAESVAALLALAKENGIDLTAEHAEKLFSEWHTTKELSDDELDSVAGGCNTTTGQQCPKCGSMNVSLLGITVGFQGTGTSYECMDCGYQYGHFNGTIDLPEQQRKTLDE